MDLQLRDSVARQLEYMAGKFPDHVAYSFPDERVKFTFRQTENEVNRAAKALLASGMKKGDHIAVWSTNCAHWIIVLLAAAKIGAPFVPINSNYTAKELEYIIGKSRPKMIFCMSEYRKKSTREQLENCSAAAGIPWVHIGSAHPHAYCPVWDEFLTRGEAISDEVLAETAAQVTGDDIYSIQFTSGTTAMPKGALLCQNAVLHTTQAYAQCMHLTETDVMAIPLPLFHVYGNVLTALSPVVDGACSVYQTAFSVEPFLKLLESERCTAVNGVPTMYMAMISHPDFPKYDLSRLVKGAMGGAYCPMAQAEEFERRMHMKLSIGFGMSECASLCTFSDIDAPIEQRLGSVGVPLEGVEIKIGELTSEGQGEMLVRGYCVMKGYYDSPEETAAALSEDGWLHTGDVCTIDETGAVQVTGRLKDIIIRGGENITPGEIEGVLLTMDAVQDVRCVGVRDETYGEEIAAFIIPRGGMEICPDEVRQYVKERMAFFKIPRYVFTIDAFPINGAGKVMNSKLRKKAEALVNGKEA